jgi:hypothetical protein
VRLGSIPAEKSSRHSRRRIGGSRDSTSPHGRCLIAFGSGAGNDLSGLEGSNSSGDDARQTLPTGVFLRENGVLRRISTTLEGSPVNRGLSPRDCSGGAEPASTRPKLRIQIHARRNLRCRLFRCAGSWNPRCPLRGGSENYCTAIRQEDTPQL